MMTLGVAENWKAWLSENGPRLLLFARSWCQTREDAEDLVQEAVLKMWHHQADRGHLPPDLPLVFSTIRFCGPWRASAQEARGVHHLSQRLPGHVARSCA
jgi:hypothetical protein